MPDIDLADLSDGYRHRPIGQGGIRRATMSARGISGLVLDVGGGGGEHSVAMRSEARTPVVIDIEASMCRTARRRGVMAIRASSEMLPVVDDAAGLAFFHLSIHYGDWRAAMDQAVRVVRPGGRIDVWTFSGDGIEMSSLARWFPSVVDIDRARFPDPGAIADHLRSRISKVEIQSWPDHVRRRVGDWEAAVRSRFVSTIQLLPTNEIEAGLAEFRAMHPDPDGIYSYDVAYLRITATV